MIETSLASALATYLHANKGASLSSWYFRPFDSTADAAPALAVVRVQNVASRVVGTNLFDADVEITLRVDAADAASATLDSAHAYAFSAIRSEAIRSAVNIASQDVFIYGVPSASGDTDATIDGDGIRTRRITARAVVLAKKLT